jgi:hypothetical protein
MYISGMVTRNSLGQFTRESCGECSPRWKGRIFREGYVYVVNKDHPFASKQGYVAEHRLVVEKHIGRVLREYEIVHHINGVKDDNGIDNLKLCGGHSEHRNNHFILGWSREFENCKVCGSNIKKHAGHGLCTTCYVREKSWEKFGKPNRDENGKIIRSKEYRVKISLANRSRKVGVRWV